MKKLIIVLLILFLGTPAFAQIRKAAGGTPTLGTCGTSPSVSGKDEGGTITVGTTMGTGCTLNFSQTYGAAPACVVISENGGDVALTAGTSTTALIIQDTNNLVDSSKLHYICIMP